MDGIGMNDARASVEWAELALPCDPLEPSLRYFQDRLGFRLDAIHPADAPRVAVLSGYGLRLRLAPGPGDPGRLRLGVLGREAGIEVAPNGTVVEFVAAESAVRLPASEPRFAITRFDEGGFGIGRAGMQYRDLVPDRLGGRAIASHIRIPEGGPVPDHVHFHRVRFQMIYCLRGWVRVVYQGAGAPFVLEAGDCVLQPPGIRHRVLECSAGLEVVEVGCPAEHETRLDHERELPDEPAAAARFDGQRFCRHVAAEASWSEAGEGLQTRDLGIEAATAGVAAARVLRARDAGADTTMPAHRTLLVFGLSGQALVHRRGREHAFAVADAALIPAAEERRWQLEPGAELLVVELPEPEPVRP